MMDFTPYLTAVVMLLGILVGTLITPKINHRIGIQYSRRDLIFKRKLDYFEKILEVIEKNRRMYKQAIKKAECSKTNKDIEKIIMDLKQNRKNFLIMSSPLYFNTKTFSEKILPFVKIEKEIFNRFFNLRKVHKKNKILFMEKFKEDLERLEKRGNEIIIEMKKELAK